MAPLRSAITTGDRLALIVEMLVAPLVPDEDGLTFLVLSESLRREALALVAQQLEGIVIRD